MNPRKTVLEIVQSTTGWLQKQGVESPRLNAELLLAHVLKIKRLDLYLDFERTLYEDELAPLRELIRKRAAGIPLQHLLGTVEFFGRTFATDARALIPRPETERLLEILLPLIRASAPAPLRLADIGTGSGIIALTLAAELPEAEVWAIDLHPETLALAQENATRLVAAASPPPEVPAASSPHLPAASLPHFHFLQSDLLDSATGPFHWIIANLPYIPGGDLPTLSKEVQHDPVTALDGGTGGLDLIRRLIAQAPAKLHPGGCLALEIGHDQADRVAGLLAAANFRDIRIEKDYQDISRFLIALHG